MKKYINKFKMFKLKKYAITFLILQTISFFIFTTNIFAVTYNIPIVFDEVDSSQPVYDTTIDKKSYYLETTTFLRLKKDTIPSARNVNYSNKDIDGVPVRYLSNPDFAEEKVGLSNIRTNGALPMLLSCLIQYKVKDYIYPTDIVNIMENISTNSSNGGNVFSIFKVLESYKIGAQYIDLNTVEDLTYQLDSKNKIILITNPGYFAEYNSYILVTGYVKKDDKVYFNILDTTSNTNTNRAHQFDKFKSTIMKAILVK